MWLCCFTPCTKHRKPMCPNSWCFWPHSRSRHHPGPPTHCVTRASGGWENRWGVHAWPAWYNELSWDIRRPRSNISAPPDTEATCTSPLVIATPPLLRRGLKLLSRAAKTVFLVFKSGFGTVGMISAGTIQPHEFAIKCGSVWRGASLRRH